MPYLIESSKAKTCLWRSLRYLWSLQPITTIIFILYLPLSLLLAILLWATAWSECTKEHYSRWMLVSSRSEELNISRHCWRRGPSWQLLTPPSNPLQSHKGSFLPQYAGNRSTSSLQAKFILWYCWAFWTHWGSHLESSDNACWISERMGFFCCCCCWGGDGVLHCLNWQQVLTAAFLACLGCDIASSDTVLTGRHDGRQRTSTPARVVLHCSKKLVWILQQGLWCGDSWLHVLPASCFLLCMAHFWYFLHISSISFIDILLQLSTYTPAPLQKNMAHEITSQRAMPLARSEEVNVRNTAKGA